MRYTHIIFHLITLVTLVSCSTVAVDNGRAPAEEAACNELVKRIILSENYEQDLSKVLVQKKLITFTEKKAQIHYPKLEWINRVRKSFHASLRNWNNNRYPSFYLFNKEDIVPTAKIYSANLEKIITNQVPLEDEEITKAYLNVAEWTKSFKNYQSELNQLIEERISLQYNLSLLKKLKLKDNDPIDVHITIKREGVLKNEIITLRREDKNLKALINKLKMKMVELDGTFIKNGKIKDRIVRQAMLLDILGILHREMEFVIKNSPTPNEETLKELASLSALIKNTEFSPSTYGIYKIENKVFIREILTATKIDKLYTKIKDPIIKIKNVLTDYFKNRKAGTDQEKVGFLKRVYAKITAITPKQAATGGGAAVAAAIGYERYFAFSNVSATETDDQTKEVEIKSEEVAREETIGADDLAHEEQIEQSKKVDIERHEGHSSVVEIHIDELTK